MTDKEKLELYEKALNNVEHHIQMSRIWGGMGWRYNAMPEFRVVKIQNIINKVFKQGRGREYVEATVKLKDKS
jgi:hypothetical protein